MPLLIITLIYLTVLHVLNIKSELLFMLPIGIFVYLKVQLASTKRIMFNSASFSQLVTRNGKVASCCEFLVIVCVFLAPTFGERQTVMYYVIVLIFSLLIYRYLVLGLSGLIHQKWQQTNET